MLGNLITVSKLDTSSLSSNTQNSALDQLAKAREAKASNWAKQTQDTAQKAKAPNQIDAVIGLERPREPFSIDLIDIKEIKSDALADSFGSQSLKQDAAAEKPIAPDPIPTLGSAENGGWQRAKNDQVVNSHNNIRARIDQPALYSYMGTPTADIYVDLLDSTGSGAHVELQDLIQNATVGKNLLPSSGFSEPVTGGGASNEGDQITGSTQDIDSQNFVDLEKNIGESWPNAWTNPDPSVRRLNSTGTGDNVQAQSAAQYAFTEARNPNGADASGKLLEKATSNQGVNSSNVVNMRINDTVNAYQTALAEKYNSTSSGSNLQDQLASQWSETTYRGAASNQGEQGQWSAQNVGSGNWLDIRM